MRRAWWIPLLLASLAGACAFEPDLSRFPECGPAGQCPAGSSCLSEVARCVPDCGERCTGTDGGTLDAGGDAGTDAGSDAGVDAGVDAGTDAGEPDAGGDDAGAPLALAAATLPPATETSPYAFTFMPSGGTPPWSFSIDGGVPGFTLDVNGTLAASAAPTPGSFGFEITVRDDAVPRASVTRGYTLVVRPLLRVASRAPLTEGRSGQAYTLLLAATGGQPPYTWSLDGGALPTGYSLAADGTVSGSSGQASTASFTAVVVDSATPPQVASRALTLQVKLLDTLLVIATPAASDGRVGSSYTQSLKAFGGTQPYSWSVVGGALPPGVTLVDTGTLGRLGGTPTDAGSYSFTVQCNDLLTNQQQALNVVVHP